METCLTISDIGLVVVVVGAPVVVLWVMPYLLVLLCYGIKIPTFDSSDGP